MKYAAIISLICMMILATGCGNEASRLKNSKLARTISGTVK